MSKVRLSVGTSFGSEARLPSRLPPPARPLDGFDTLGRSRDRGQDLERRLDEAGR